jgi:ATP-dependent RNA helicase DDX41
MVAATNGRRRSESPDTGLPSDYKPYVPVAKRRAQLLSHLGSKHQAKKVKITEEELRKEMADEQEGIEEVEEREREKLRRERTLLQAAQEVKERKAIEDAEKSAAEISAEREAALLKEMERGQKKLAGAQEIAQGTTWTESMKTS